MTRKYMALVFLLVVSLLLSHAPVSRLLSFSRRALFSAMADSTDAAPAAAAAAGLFSAAFVTVPNMEVAGKLAAGLVTQKLAACVNIIPGVTSVYEWEGKVEQDSELLLMIKTRTERVDELSAWVKDNHPYDVCEVISTEIDNGNPPYLKWLGETVPPKS